MKSRCEVCPAEGGSCSRKASAESRKGDLLASTPIQSGRVDDTCQTLLLYAFLGTLLVCHDVNLHQLGRSGSRDGGEI